MHVAYCWSPCFPLWHHVKTEPCAAQLLAEQVVCVHLGLCLCTFVFFPSSLCSGFALSVFFLLNIVNNISSYSRLFAQVFLCLLMKKKEETVKGNTHTKNDLHYIKVMNKFPLHTTCICIKFITQSLWLCFLFLYSSCGYILLIFVYWWHVYTVRKQKASLFTNVIDCLKIQNNCFYNAASNTGTFRVHGRFLSSCLYTEYMTHDISRDTCCISSACFSSVSRRLLFFFPCRHCNMNTEPAPGICLRQSIAGGNKLKRLTEVLKLYETSQNEHRQWTTW